MNIHQSAASVNSLIRINNDRIHAYELARRVPVDADLQQLFIRYTDNSSHANRALLDILAETGSRPGEDNPTIGLLFRTWQDIRSEIYCHNRFSIIHSCLIGERAVLNHYNQVLSESPDNFTLDQFKTIYRQYIAQKEDIQKLYSLQQLLSH